MVRPLPKVFDAWCLASTERSYILKTAAKTYKFIGQQTLNGATGLVDAALNGTIGSVDRRH